LPLRRDTPFTFNSEQKSYLAKVFGTPSEGTRRTRQRGVERDAFTTERDDFLVNAFEQLTWLTTQEGKDHLDSRDEDTISASASIITNTMHLAAEAGHSPLQVLQAAVLSYSTQRGEDDEFRIIYEFLEEMQDIADETIGKLARQEI
jgi:hypothetical protein